jgi:hypothetical protein
MGRLVPFLPRRGTRRIPSPFEIEPSVRCGQVVLYRVGSFRDPDGFLEVREIRFESVKALPFFGG